MIWSNGWVLSTRTAGTPTIKTRPMLVVGSAFCLFIGSVCADYVIASTIEVFNHTHWAINRFSVDGRSGFDTIGPFQGGGGGCCYVAPARWQAGTNVQVEWETGAGSELAREFPGFGDEAKYDAWLDKVEAQKRQHSKTVPVPDYTEQKVCGITVHFFPCDEVQVTTSCLAFGSPDYPINTPLKAPRPTSCRQPPVALQEVRP